MPAGIAKSRRRQPQGLIAQRESKPRRSIRLDVGVLDHLPPERQLSLDVVAEFFWRRRETFETDILEPGLCFGTIDDLAQRRVELGHDLRRRTGRCDQASPGVEIETFDAAFIY